MHAWLEVSHSSYKLLRDFSEYQLILASEKASGSIIWLLNSHKFSSNQIAFSGFSALNSEVRSRHAKMLSSD